jgi:hypothetical protein
LIRAQVHLRIHGRLVWRIYIYSSEALEEARGRREAVTGRPPEDKLRFISVSPRRTSAFE